MPGSQYDKFYLQEFIKKYPTYEELDKFIERVNDIQSSSTEDYIKSFEELVNKEQDIKMQ